MYLPRARCALGPLHVSLPESGGRSPSLWNVVRAGRREEVRYIPGVGAEEVDAKSSQLSGWSPGHPDHDPLHIIRTALRRP